MWQSLCIYETTANDEQLEGSWPFCTGQDEFLPAPIQPCGTVTAVQNICKTVCPATNHKHPVIAFMGRNVQKDRVKD